MPSPVCTPTRYSILYGKTPAVEARDFKNWQATPKKETSITKMIKSVNSKYKTGILVNGISL